MLSRLGQPTTKVKARHSFNRATNCSELFFTSRIEAERWLDDYEGQLDQQYDAPVHLATISKLRFDMYRVDVVGYLVRGA